MRQTRTARARRHTRCELPSPRRRQQTQRRGPALAPRDSISQRREFSRELRKTRMGWSCVQLMMRIAVLCVLFAMAIAGNARADEARFRNRNDGRWTLLKFDAQGKLQHARTDDPAIVGTN